MRNKIIAVDFDGTLVENKWPEIGSANTKVLDYCKEEQAKGTRIILWTNRVGDALDAAVKWCKENDLHLDAVNDNIQESIDFFGFNTRKIYADEFIDDRALNKFSLPYSEETSNTWAAKEVDLACQKEREAAEGTDDWKYGVGCYESALKAYHSLCQDGHSGFSIQLTKGILNRLIDGKCLTPIEDTPDIWEPVKFGEDDPKTHYQCKRMSSLFKDVAEDGTVTYSDVSRVQAINIDNPDVAFQNGFVTRLVDKIFPITMPYFPASKKFRVYREEFLTDTKNGDYDTVAFLYIITPDGKKIDLNRYFKEGPDGMVAIDQAEYDERKARRIDKK